MRTPERSPQRDAAIEAMLPHVPYDGWTLRALRRGLEASGGAAVDAELLFPGGPDDMIATFTDWADRRMEAGAAALDMADLRAPARVRTVIGGPARAARSCPGGRRDRSADGGRDLARGRRPVRRFRLVYQAVQPGPDLRRDAAGLAARQQRGRCGDACIPRPAIGGDGTAVPAPPPGRGAGGGPRLPPEIPEPAPRLTWLGPDLRAGPHLRAGPGILIGVLAAIY